LIWLTAFITFLWLQCDKTQKMTFSIVPAGKEDGKAIIDIFNHYIENSFAAFPEHAVPYQLIDQFRKISEGYPFFVARDGANAVLGFAMLRPHSPMPVFSRTAEISYFIAPEHRAKGIGTALQERLIKEAKTIGITTILAGISSLNKESLAFHMRCGFVECGRFINIGKKWGRDFDVVWMQRMI